MEEILRLFPKHLRQAVELEIGSRWRKLQEIRCRLYKPIELNFDDGVSWVKGVYPTKKDGVHILNQLSEFSLYRMEDELREGYMTIQGGHRVGLAGKVNTLNGSVKAILNITFFNIRIAKEQKGIAERVIPYIHHPNMVGYHNTLIIGPPQTGKTTILRDVARLISTGWKKVEAKKVGIIDERSEIAASIKGVPQHDIGLRTDVMDACPKSEGMMMMIRSMSPEVLIIDEIGSKQDVQALLEAIHAGVTIICTIHGQSLKELKRRPSLQSLFQEKVFQRFIVLSSAHTPGYIQHVFDQESTKILPSAEVYHV